VHARLTCTESTQRQGFFQNAPDEPTSENSDFLTLVAELWKLVNRRSSNSNAAAAVDSTTDFDVSGWAKIKADQYEVALLRARKSTDHLVGDQSRVSTGRSARHYPGTANSSSDARTASIPGSAISGRPAPNRSASAARATRAGSIVSDTGAQIANAPQEEEVGANDAAKDKDESGRARAYYYSAKMGVEGLSLDSVSSVNVFRWLRRIAIGLHTKPLGMPIATLSSIGSAIHY
ncbi:hypothetical protein HK405_001062, partial [Cladochytrium tenue]